MARMERHLAASTPAPATSSATHSAPFYSGEFHSFIHFHSELLKFAYVFRNFTFGFSKLKFSRLLSLGFDPSRDRATREIGFCLHPDPVVLHRI
jgi:hypothetical protein